MTDFDKDFIAYMWLFASISLIVVSAIGLVSMLMKMCN